jgi:hypothetical protein
VTAKEADIAMETAAVGMPARVKQTGVNERLRRHLWVEPHGAPLRNPGRREITPLTITKVGRYWRTDMRVIFPNNHFKLPVLWIQTHFFSDSDPQIFFGFRFGFGSLH